MTNQVATTGGRDAATAFQTELDAYTPNLQQALPAHVSVDKFKRVLVTAVGMNPELYYANRRTLFTAAVRCAADGLLPDGREAALVTYRTKTKQRDPQSGIDREVWIEAVTYMPMVAGIRKRMRNSGDVLSATAEVVHERDQFRYKLGDDAMIEHEPPALGQDRGKPVGAYAIIKLRSGEVLRDVLTLQEIEAARAQGRSTNSLMWTKFWAEGAKKTALRRCAKAAPQSAEFEALLSREEEPPLLPDHHDGGPLPALPQAPQRNDLVDEIEPPDMEFEVFDSEGAMRVFRHGPSAVAALCEILPVAAQLGPDRLQAVWEDNRDSLEELERHGVDVRQAKDVYEHLKTPPSPPAETRPQQDVQPAPSPDAAGAAGERRVPRRNETEPATARDALDDLLDRPDDNASPHESKALEMVMSRGRPDYPTWTRARLIPRMRRQRTTQDLAYFLGDNDENIEQAKRHPELQREIDLAITEQWRLVDEVEQQ